VRIIYKRTHNLTTPPLSVINKIAEVNIMYKMIPYTNVRTANQPTNELIEDRWFDKKLFTSSRSLYHQLQRNENLQKATMAKSKYINRSRYRATPFGLFSSVSFGKIAEGDHPKNQMMIQNEYKVYTSIDSEWVSKFITHVKMENLSNLKVQWNANVIYQNSNFLYNNWTLDDKKKFSSNKIQVNNLIEAIKDQSKSFISLSELSEKLAEHHHILLPPTILTSIVKQLVKGGYLITDLDDLTFIRDFDRLIQYLEDKNYLFPKETIYKVRELMKSLNQSINHFHLETVIELEERLASITTSKHYLRFDSETNVLNLDLDKKGIEESIIPFVNFLSSYAVRVPLSERYQADVLFFKEKFGNTKVRFLDFYRNYQLVREKNRSLESKLSPLEEKMKTQLIALISTAEKLNVKEIDVSKLSFEEVKIEREIPPTVQTCFHVESVDGKLFFSLTPYAGNNGLGRLEGRFSYIDSDYFTTTKNIEKSKLLEANTEVVTVKYMPKNHHYYNIMTDCDEGHLNLQFGAAENDLSISLEDLFISIQDHKLTLSTWIDGTEKIVKFEQYNVANTEYFSPHILQDLIFWSNQYYSSFMSFINDVQRIRKDFIYFPKIEFNGIELSPQSWLIKNYLGDALSKEQFFNKFDEMKKIYDMPSSVFVRCNDLKLLIDTTCKEDLTILWDIYKSETSLDVYLEENTMNFSNLVTLDSEGNRYISEFIFNFVAKKVNTKKLIQHTTYHSRERLNLKRNVQWHQFNLYLPHEHHDDFLGTVLSELVDDLKSNEVINQFFFIRYFDDRHHIRVRFSPGSQFDIDLIDRYLAKAVIKGDIIDYGPGKYEPEYERYGGFSVITAAEDFFCADSSIILSLLQSCLANENIDKVDHAIYLIFKLLSTHTKDVTQQFLVMNDGYSNRDFAKNYRENRKKYMTYHDLATSSLDVADHLVFNADQLACWEVELANYFTKLKNEQQFEINIVRSLIHMMCIRLFGIKSEEEELVGNMVWRVLKQKVAMEKYNSNHLILHG